jgi:hypothetical protein
LGLDWGAIVKRERLPVIFRMQDGEVVAVFPTLAGTNEPGSMTTYDHVGQHGSCSLDWYVSRKHRPATRREYLPLLRELRRIYGRPMFKGDRVYTLVVARRRDRRMVQS